MCVISLCTRGALDTRSRGRSTAALCGTSRASPDLWFALSRAKEATVRSLLVVLGIVVSSLGAVGAAGQAAGDGASFVLRVDPEGSFFLADAPLDEASVVAQAAAALGRD